MFINRLNQLYKPRRILYYIELPEEKIKAFYNGEICEEVGKYADAFGTYDYPGLFFVDALDNKEVIGIEYRIGDERINYPEGLKSIILDEAYYYQIEVDNDIEVDIGRIRKRFEEIEKGDNAHRIYTDLHIQKTPHVISVFLSRSKFRMLYEWKLDYNRALPVINDDIQNLDKDMLYKMAFFDPITNHYNWNHLVPFLETPMDAGITDYAFVHFDIKQFKLLNDVYGHISANKVLSNVVRAMKESDFIYTSARCHNDNFAMMIKDMPEQETIEKLEEFFESISHIEEDPNYKIYYRCGVVPMRTSVLSANRVADAGKMAQAMGTNRNKTDIVIYTDRMHDDILWSNYIKAYVDTALENDEFVVFLQPKFDIYKEKIKGAEALIRWNYKKKEMLPPYRFIPFFEKDGSIGKIDDVVLEKVCRSLAKWKKEGRELYPISVNLSRSRLYDRGLVKRLTEIVDTYGVDHGLIDFELTESASYDNKDQMINVLTELRSQGFKISMDDFGTGYSSLSLLTEIPLDTLKIDKSFVDKVGVQEEVEKDIIVLKYIISLSRELGYVCLAEGAEEKCQVDRLRELGCEIIQGYYYSKPVPIKEYETEYLR